MVRAILQGRKTQTRRVLRVSSGTEPGKDCAVSCPYGATGDHLWVKETHYVDPSGGVLYRADDSLHDQRVPRWSPSIFMPRWASRISLEVVRVRIEQLQSASNADFVTEGIESLREGELGYLRQNGSDWRSSYRELWDSLNAERGFAWDVNPWVWVVEFVRL
jgi:hypothetical protein